MSLFVQIKTTVLTEAKFLAAGPEASWMYLRGLCWSKDHLTDGEVPRAALAIVGAGIDDPAAAAQKLVDAKLWTETEDGWTVGSDRWARHQQTKAQVEAKREADRERLAERRKKAPKRVARDTKKPTAASRKSVARDNAATPQRLASDSVASSGAEYIAQSTEPENISPPPRASNRDTAPAAPGGGGGDCAGFEGDLTAAIHALAGLKVNGAEALARQAGGERVVLYAVEQAKAPGVKNRGAMAAKLIRDGERPPDGWRSKAERAADLEVMEETRRLASSQNPEERARNQAELELIERHEAIADRAAAKAAEGNGLDARTLRAKPRHLWTQHRLARAAVVAAIENETGDTVDGLLASGRDSA